ncbi:polysulfide reductase NrfD [Lutimonas halocynthiae]|uniref:NrfD/PsrC family molybdoenzyme membrane anchor subunit n=1 Tax=Lutimonas halocynthiae TaxID=1446477 RepID=UPI0025B33781|nr:NrfD/PsrC family molybdoenzyme membrane anchor subunit [Lutimonas halocynthiae]MDN3643696.1 polysulfide reductase NrfD [Lutimonas halocynthiae]
MKSREQFIKDLAPKKFTKPEKIWLGLLLIIIVAGMLAYVDQIRKGLQVTSLNDYALWGIYISNFVFFIATSFVGAATVAILRLTKNHWRTPLVRIAEIISLAAIIMAGITIIIDLGRPDRALYTIIHARFQSPITWDVIIIPTYLVAIFFLLYFPLLPDLAILKKLYSKDNPRLSKWYGKLSLNWTGSVAQKAIQQKSIKIIAILVLPLGLILQTIDAWLFSSTYRIGWNSTNFGPYFISGAFVAGVATLVVTIYMVRKVKGLEEYITDYHFDKMGKFLALACLIYLYFNANEYLMPAYASTVNEEVHLETLFTGHYSTIFWFVTIGGLIIPVILLLFKKGRSPIAMFWIGLLVIVASWWKRYIIVTPTLLHPYLPIQGVPESWRHYFPSIHEWLITASNLATALLILTLLVRYLPVVAIQRSIDEQESDNNDQKSGS